jgi:hypothetical protein
MMDNLFYDAIYSKQVVEDYTGNPLIEALPPILSDNEVIRKITSTPKYHPDERLLGQEVRYHCVQRLFSYFEPLVRHLDLQQRISAVIREGYLSRNPLGPEYAAKLQKGYRIIKSGEYELIDDIRYGSTASGFTIIGISGIGKSRTINRILTWYPQVIVHSKYRDLPLSLYQLTWLKVDCPTDGSIKGLCINFFQAVDERLGTNYFRKFGSARNSIDMLLPRMVQIASLHCLGLLVIDEIQHLSVAKSGGADKMLNFFVTLVNTISVPIVLIGTPKALPIVQGDFRQARRSSGQGDMVWNRMIYDDQWELLMKGMWEYQWTKEEVELTPEFEEVIYYESQGIIDIAIKLYVLTQWRAIALGEETFTPENFHIVAMESLQMVQPMLEALRTGNKKQINQFHDITPIDLTKVNKYFQSKLVKDSQSNSEHYTNKPNDTDLYELVEEIISRLTKVGVQPSKAQEVAATVVKGNPDIDLQSATSKALSLALEIKDTTKNKGHKKVEKQPDDLRLIVKNGKEEKISGYEALLKAGYIKSPNEFMNVDVEEDVG